MSNETLEELKAILYGAPDGFTMVSFCGGFYGTITPGGWLLLNRTTKEAKFVSINSLMAMRSLLDIKARIQVMEQVKSCYEAYSRIEDVNQQYNARNKQLTEALKGVMKIFSAVPDGFYRNELSKAREALGYGVPPKSLDCSGVKINSQNTGDI